MGEPQLRRPGLVVVLLLIVGIAGSILALKARESEPLFVSAQEHLVAVTAPALQELMSTTRDPRPRYSGRARSARCQSQGKGGLGNPWTCVVRYQREPEIRYQVSVHANLSIVGSGEPEGKPLRGKLIVHGCCVAERPA